MAHSLEGYQLRESQLQLAEAIAENLGKDGVLLGEAGTGTGKTFAYLLPVLESGKKALLSTATKNLQEQIFTSDLPLVRKVLHSPAQVVLLKGRGNYFCHYHHSQLQQRPPRDHKEKSYRLRIDRFAEKTRDGDLVTLHDVPEDDELITAITSTADNCLGRDCPFHEQCFVRKARQQAKEADVVIVNHHLLLADFSLKSDGFAEILPDIEAFIIDEAHHLPQTAIHFLGERFSYRQIRLLLEDIEQASVQEAQDALELKQGIVVARQALDGIPPILKNAPETRLDGGALAGLTPFWHGLGKLDEALDRVKTALWPHRERGKHLANVAERLSGRLDLLRTFLPCAGEADAMPIKPLPEKGAQEPGTEKRPDEQADKEARWLEINPKSFVLNRVPVNAASRFAHWIGQSAASWTFLSATLAVDGSFDHFRRELGLGEVATLQLGSPFDYRRQALLYHPQGLPDPNHPEYTRRLIEKVLPVFKRSRGRAFLLFTSYRAMHAAKDLLQGGDFDLLVQGQAPKVQLLDDFRRREKPLLLATASFWEGVDVRGDRLVCVVIDKLPFAAPNDPVTKARHHLLERQHLAPFIHDTLPQAVITLKQGVGRLIRDGGDYGVLVIGDPRLSRKSYGNTFLESLPRMTRTKKLDIVDRFFTYHEERTS